jgi:uncharacterized membrane protein
MGLLGRKRGPHHTEPAHFNRAAGRSPSRIAELSDGVFSIAMTLLVLELHAPVTTAIRDQAQLAAGLVAIAPKLAAWGMSFLTLGVFWIAQSTQIEALARSDRDQTWLHLVFLALISLVPFTAAILGEFWNVHLAMIVFWFNIALLGVVQGALWSHAERHAMFRDSVTPAIIKGVERRIVVSQLLYLVAMLVSAFGAIYGLILMTIVQLNYAFAPRIGRWLG